MKKTILLFVVMIFVFFSAAFAQDLPKIAVYVTGDIPDNNKRVFGPQMLAALVNSGRYIGIERPNVFFAEAERKRTAEYGGAINDKQLSELGKESGVDYICVADIIPAFGVYQIEVRIVDAKTAETVLFGEAASQLKTIDDLTNISNHIVKNMLGGEDAAEQSEAAEAQDADDGEPAPVAYAQTPPPAPAPVSSAPVIPSRQPAAPPVAFAPAPSAPVAVAPAAPQVTWPPKVAVYVTGLSPAMLSNALSRAVSSALMKAKIYEGIESIDQHITGAPNDVQIIEAGKKAGVHFVFVVNVSGQINVRILDVDLAMETAKVSLDGKINSPIDAGRIALSIVNFILKSGPKPPPGYTPPAAPAPAARAERDTERRTSAGRIDDDDYTPRVRTAQEGERRYPRNSLGATFGTNGIDYNLRIGTGEYSRLYFGVGYWSGYGGREGYDGDYDWKGSETHIGSFFEWRSNNGVFDIYFGPGCILGFYEYRDYYSYYSYYSYYDRTRGQGFGLGVQTGLELRLGWFLVAADTRLGYYWRSMGNSGHAAAGIRTGIAF